MKRRFYHCIFTFCCILLCVPLGLSAKDSLTEAFTHPPENAKPWVYWYWMQGNATAEGITRDLEAMAETGIGGAMLMPIGRSTKATLADPQANPLSEQFWKLVVHATKEADRLGMGLEMNACDGWALAGGPWITPEMSMQEVVMTERVIAGGRPFTGKLAQPRARRDYYRDVAVLAFPCPVGTGITSTELKPKATTSIKGLDPQLLVSGADKPIQYSSWGWVQFEFEEPFTCRSIRIAPDIKNAYQLSRAELQVSDDGQTFRSLGRLNAPKFHGWQDDRMHATYAIEPLTAKFFRFVIDPEGTPPYTENREGGKIRFRNRKMAQLIELSSQPRIHQWEGKAGYRWRRSEWTSREQCPSEWCVPADKIVNISGKMNPDGTLAWTPPPGEWTIQRIGYTTTGVINRPAGTGAGLECDKFNPKAAQIQFDGWFGEAIKRVGPQLAGKTLRNNHTDSWEAVSQNWSPVFRDEFRKRRGYDPLPWLPVMSGIPVESAELSERFLYDIRLTISDLVSDSFFGEMTRLGRQHGTGFSAECIAPTMMADGLELFQYADIPMGEFWLSTAHQDKPNDILDAISGGHIYGKRIIGAEAFTQNPLHMNEHPSYMKPLGDDNFAKGVNKFYLHVWAQQAFDREPGMTLFRVGTFFSGTQTWHKPGKAWFDYTRRCSAMLQQGLPVADVCYFIGEEQPSRAYLPEDLPMAMPEGYKYDCINRDALLNRAQAENQRLVLPDGVSYRLLVLPSSEHMSPELAQKIGELAEVGVPVIGSAPGRSISLTDYPDCDDKVQNTVSKTWNAVRSDTTPEALLKTMSLPPDVEFIGETIEPVYRERLQYHSPDLVWNHRKTKEADLYFISNQTRGFKQVDVAFRMTGKIPELWDAESGEMVRAPVWRHEDSRTVVSLDLPPAGSLFVIFRSAAIHETDPIAKISSDVPASETTAPSLWIEEDRAWATENGTWQLTRQSGRTLAASFKNLPARKRIGPWTVTLPPDVGAPEQIELQKLISLSEHSNSGVKHFSGTATYNSTFEVENNPNQERLFLDLGDVANLAEVTLNGKNLGVLWTPPFTVEITDAVKPGANKLKIDVTNTWRNRLIGESALPVEDRRTWTYYRNVYPKPQTPLEPAGLLGPVTLKSARGQALGTFGEEQ